jgi:hypothetical protein
VVALVHASRVAQTPGRTAGMNKTVYLVMKSCPPEPGEDVVAAALTLDDARDALKSWAADSRSRLPLRRLHGKDRWETADGFWEVEITPYTVHVKKEKRA